MYYNVTKRDCDNCSSGCLICDNPSTCSACEYGHTLLENGSCLLDEHCQWNIGGVCMTCELGYTISQYGICTSSTIEGCLIEQDNGCTLCNMTTLTTGDECVPQIGMIQSNGVNSPIICVSGYYNDNRTCKKCRDKYGEECDECDSNTCYHCVPNDGGVTVEINSTGHCEVFNDCNIHILYFD